MVDNAGKLHKVGVRCWGHGNPSNAHLSFAGSGRIVGSGTERAKHDSRSGWQPSAQPRHCRTALTNLGLTRGTAGD